jgi:hypothetical protein
VFGYLGKLQPLAKRILTNREAADYELILLSTELFFERIIHLYRQHYPSTKFEAFKIDSSEHQGPLLKILFQGDWQYDHFLTIMLESTNEQYQATLCER